MFVFYRFKIDNDEGIFKKAWLKLDMQELDNFDFNQCDDRFELLEQCKTF